MGKRLLSILGLLIAIVGIVFGGNLVLIIVGCVILGLGQMIKDKEESTTFSMDVIIKEFLEDVQFNPNNHMLNVSDTNIPLPKHDYCSGDGYVQGKYKGLDVELCTIKLTDVTEVLRDDTGLWERMKIQSILENGCCVSLIVSLILGLLCILVVYWINKVVILEMRHLIRSLICVVGMRN